MELQLPCIDKDSFTWLHRKEFERKKKGGLLSARKVLHTYGIESKKQKSFFPYQKSSKHDFIF